MTSKEDIREPSPILETPQENSRQRRYGIRPLGRTRSEGVPIHTRRRTMSVDCTAQSRIDTFDGGGPGLLEESKNRLPPPVRRLSDLKALTTTLGLHIHGSLLSLAGNYDKARKQVNNVLIGIFRCRRLIDIVSLAYKL